MNECKSAENIRECLEKVKPSYWNFGNCENGLFVEQEKKVAFCVDSPQKYAIFENLDLRFGGGHGIAGGNTQNIIARACDVSYMGGGAFYILPYGWLRYGNGIEFWGNAKDNLVEQCRISQIYDAALTNQNEGSTVVQENIIYRNNLISGAEYSFEYWNRPAGSVTNNIFFINWSKIKGTDKESKKLRKSGGVGYGGDAVFDDFIRKTRKERDVVLIIDEAHTETDTHLANEVVDLIDPRIILKITATPKDLPNISDVSQKKAGFVEALESDVIASGLIKEKIIIQTEEDIKKLERRIGQSEIEMLEINDFNVIFFCELNYFLW